MKRAGKRLVGTVQPVWPCGSVGRCDRDGFYQRVKQLEATCCRSWKRKRVDDTKKANWINLGREPESRSQK